MQSHSWDHTEFANWSIVEWRGSHQWAVTCWISVQSFCVWWRGDAAKMRTAPQNAIFTQNVAVGATPACSSTWRGGRWLADWSVQLHSFWVKIHMCTAQQETWTDLHHLCVAETFVALAVPCCRLMLMAYIFKHCGVLILKIISIQAHRNVERECACAWCVCVCWTNRLISSSKFVTEKERIHYSKIIVLVVLLSLYRQRFLCVILTWVRIWMCER